MLMNNFLKSRNSTREFKNKEISEDTKNKLLTILQELNSEVRSKAAELVLEENADGLAEELQGRGGYSGLMIKAPLYIALKTYGDKPIGYIEGAYYLEDFTTRIKELGLSTCWISLKDVTDDLKNVLFSLEDSHVDYLLAVGYPQSDEVKEHRSDDRIGIDKIVFIDDFYSEATIEQLEERGMDQLFYYLRFAPSTYNRQPWRFVLKDSEVLLYIEDYQGIENLIDSGIVMYYFKKLTENLAINTIWEVKPELEEKKYSFIAKTKI